MAGKPRGRGGAFSDDVMDDEDDRQLLDILGDVDALNDYLHGSNSKSIGEDDVTNAAYGSDSSFFSADTPVSNPSGLKDVPDFGMDASLQPLSGSLSFIEDELGSPRSPNDDGDGGGGDDQPFDILQKSLLEADITEQTLAQEALLESQPAPSLVQPPVSFPSIVPGNMGGAVGVVTPAGQFIQGVSQLQNGSAPHIQVLGSFGGTGGVMTLSNLERTPQLVLRPPLAAAATAQAQVGGFKNVPLQNIIIQRGPGGALVRPIQPKPLHTGAQAVYSVGLQQANAAAANGSIVVQSSVDQANATAPGQFILPGSLALAPPATAIQNGPTDANTLITAQNAVQIVGGQSFTATAGGQLVLNQAPVQAASAPGRLTLVAGQNQVPGSPVQRLLVTQTANCASLSPLPPAATQEQSSASSALKLTPLHASQTITVDDTLTAQVGLQRPVPLTRGGMVLQQVRKDHLGVLGPDKSRFCSFEDVLNRLLPYNVFQGAPPSTQEFLHVDEEFELVAAQVVNRTEAMVDKYRKLLMVEAERSSPSSEIVMIDRTFNQEERGGLTHDKRTLLLDPDGFLEDFCCGVRSSLFSAGPAPPEPPAPRHQHCFPDARSPSSPSSSSSLRTDPLQPPYSDPGGGGDGDGGQHKRPKHELKLKFQASSFAAGHYVATSFAAPNETDSALEAAVNSILEC
ncbi:BRD4-interacting chromatin-remodeling complex-associated protein-like isoform X2 [Eucyclogobius newberryi]|uniref:BRD4-interacting chromatin-remodeling complex-associated protein-like isoform X2 n=1 Tax=Eucyclogobius newberryi TaxID=166745 RepID=UPI003B59C02F